MESALNFKNSMACLYTGTTVLGEFSELQYSLSPSYQAARLLVRFTYDNLRLYFDYAMG